MALVDSTVVLADIKTGLVAKYSFNNGDARDESGNGNNGELLNGVSLTTDRFGNANFAYSFDGIDDFIKAKADNLPVRERTVALWCYVEKFEDKISLVPIGYGGGSSCATSFFFYMYKQSIGIAEHCNGSHMHYDDFTAEEALGRWYFYAITTSDNYGTKLFVNGTKVLEEKNIVFGNTYVSGRELSIGVATSIYGTAPFTDTNVTYFNGKIDDIRIYDRAISESEVLELYNEPNPKHIHINDGLVAYYPFNSNANDESGYGNDGIVYGAELASDRHGNMNSSYLFDRDKKSWIKASANDLPTKERTVSLWFYANDEDSTHIFGYGGGGGGCQTSWLMMIFQKDNAEDAYQVQSHNRVNRVLCRFSQAPIGKWYHWIITTDDSGTKMYINGKNLCSESEIFINNTFVEGKILSIGTIPDCDGIKPHLDESYVFFDGKIDDLRIYNRSLSEAEVKDLYDFEKPKDNESRNLCQHLDWKPFGGSEYALTENFGSWYDAQIEANRCGGNLVTINNNEENSWLSQQFSNTYTRSYTSNEFNSIAWIGYFINSQTKNWEWVNGEVTLYVNNFPQSGNFAYLHLPPHPSSSTWNANPIHNNDYDYNPKGIIERTISGCLSQERYCHAIEIERQKWDVNNDNKIGLEEAINALQVTSGLSNSQSEHTLSEICNNFDDDCDGEIDEGVKTVYYQDADNDSYGNIDKTIYACQQPIGYVSNSYDCNDSDNLTYPGADEICNGNDDNCDNEIDEGLSIITYCQDLDGDNYGNPSKKQQACKQPFGYVENCEDCNDSDKDIHPGATEICNGKDDNCDLEIDEGLPIITYCQDLDGDNYGNPNKKQEACKQPTGYVENCDDCNDSDINVHPGATEICNGKDDNCDGKLKEVDIMRYWGEQYDHWTTNDSVDTGSEYFNDANLGKALCEPDGDKTIPIYSCQVNYSTVPAINLNVPIPNNKVDHYLRTSCNLVPEQYNPVTLNNGKPIFYLYKSPGPNSSLIRACFFPFFGNTFETNKSNCEMDCSNFDPTNCLKAYPENEGWTCKCAEVGWLDNVDCSELGYTSSQ